MRCHKTMQKLASDLARQGIPTLRFDLSNTGDSRDIENPSMSTWRNDTRTAISCLSDLSGCERLALIGVRLGAGIVASLDTSVDQVALWDPVFDGPAYLAEIDQLHQELLSSNLYSLPGKRRHVDHSEERVGFSLKKSLRQSLLDFSAEQPTRISTRRALWINTKGSHEAAGFTNFKESCSSECVLADLDMSCYWQSVEQLENILMGQPVARTILGFLSGDGDIGTGVSIRP